MSLTEADKSWLADLMDKKFERLEVRLLAEFHKWPSLAGARRRTISAALHAIDMEMEAAAARTKRIEGLS